MKVFYLALAVAMGFAFVGVDGITHPTEAASKSKKAKAKTRTKAPVKTTGRKRSRGSRTCCGGGYR